MADNPYADLIPSGGTQEVPEPQASTNPYADLVPQKTAQPQAQPQAQGPYADLVPGPSMWDYPANLFKGFVAGAREQQATGLRGEAAAPQIVQLPGESDLEYYLRREEEIAKLAKQPVQEHPLYKAGEALSGVGKEALKPSPGFEGSWTYDIGGGFGSLGSNILTSLVHPGLGLRQMISAGAGEAAQEAIKKGATPEQVRRAAYHGTIAGATDLLDALIPMTGSIGKALGFLGKVGARAATGAFIEGSQEGLQQFMQNAIAKGIYDPTRDVWNEVPRNAAIGAIVGAAGGTVLGGEGEAKGPPITDTQREEFRKLLEGGGAELPPGAQPTALRTAPGQVPGAPVPPAPAQDPDAAFLNQLMTPQVGPQPQAPGTAPVSAPVSDTPTQSNQPTVDDIMLRSNLEDQRRKGAGQFEPENLARASLAREEAGQEIINRIRRERAAMRGQAMPTTAAEQLPLLSAIEPETRTIEAQTGIDPSRAIDIVGQAYYGDPSNMSQIVGKELLQNAVDNTKPLIQQGKETRGNIDITTDPTNRTITFHDDGTGMTPEVLAGPFFEVAGSHKEATDPSGGFGFAKAMTHYASEAMTAITLRDGVVSRVSTTGTQLRESVKDKSKRPRIDVHPATAEEKRLFPKGHGTIVTVKIPQSFMDTSTGRRKEIAFPQSYHEASWFEALKWSPLFHNIGVTYNGKVVPKTGTTFRPDKYSAFPNVKFAWGTAHIYVSKGPRDAETGTYGPNMHILSNGLFQFNRNMPKDASRSYGENMNRDFYIDISPTAKPGEPGYPFIPNRKDFTEDAARDFELITKFISVAYSQEDFNEAVKNWGDLTYLSVMPDGSLKTEKVRVEPKVPRVDNPFALIRREMEQGAPVSVRGGKLVVGGRTVPDITPEDLARTRLDTGSLKIEQSELDPNNPAMHNVVYVQLNGDAEQQAFDQLSKAFVDPLAQQIFIDPTKPYMPPGVPTTDDGLHAALPDIVRWRFGERFDRYMHDLGEMFIQLKYVVADKMLPATFQGVSLDDTVVGISFDPDYHGVSTKIPFTGVFLNPAASQYRSTVEQALGFIKTMIHELAHHNIREHNAQFVSEIQMYAVKLEAMEFQLTAALESTAMTPEGGFNFLEFKRNMMNLIEKNSDIQQYMQAMFGGSYGTVSTRGTSFADNSTEQAGDAGVVGVPPGNVGPGGLLPGAVGGNLPSPAFAREQSRPGNVSTSLEPGPSPDGGRSRNEAALAATGDPGTGSAVPIQPETAGLRQSLSAVVPPGSVPKAQQQSINAAAAHADRITWMHKFLGGMSQLVRANPNFTPLTNMWGRLKHMFTDEAEVQYEVMMVNRRWASLGDRGVDLAAYIDDIGHMTYLSPQERNAGLVRHPTTAELQGFEKKHHMDAEMLNLANDIQLFIMGGFYPQGHPKAGAHKDGFMEKMTVVAIEKVNRSLRQGKTTPKAAADAIKQLQDDLAALKKRPYFPFTNFGTHYIIANDPSGRQFHYETVERNWLSSALTLGVQSAKRVQQRRVREIAAQWEKDYGRAPVISEGNPKSDIFFGVHPDHVGPLINLPAMLAEQMTGTMAMTPEQITTSQSLQYSAANAKTPLLKPRYQRRYYVPGYDDRRQATKEYGESYSMDLRRSFARFGFHGAKYYARVKHAADLNDDVQTALNFPNSVKANDIGKFMNDYLKNTILDARGDYGNAKGAIFLFSMGYVPAAATQNMMQTPMITYPFLWQKFGLVRGTGATLKEIAREISRATVSTGRRIMGKEPALFARAPTQDEYMALEYAMQTGRITETQAPENAGIAHGDVLRGFGHGKVQRNWQKFIERAAWLFEQAEQANRRIAFRAALNLALKHPTKGFVDDAVKLHAYEYNRLVTEKGWPAYLARATVAALDTVEQTQYIYSRHDRSRIMRKPIPGVLFVFQKYIHDTLWLYGKNPGIFLRSMLPAIVIGGLGGLPFYDFLRSLIAGFGARFFGRDWDLNRAIRRYVMDSVGDTVPPDLFLHGISRYGFGVPTFLDMMGNLVTGTPGRGLVAPRMIRDPKTGETRFEGGRNVPFPVLDRSRAVTMGNPLIIDFGKLLMPTNDNDKVMLEEIQKGSGAFFSVGFNIFKTLTDNHAKMGDPKTWERMVPRAMGSAMEALRWAYEGRERSRGGPNAGATIVNFTPRDPEVMMEIIGRALGYQPLRVQGKWDAIIDQQNAIKQIDIRRQGILENFYEAMKGRNQEELAAARKDLREYNKSLPDYAKGRSISADQVIKSMEQRSKAQAMREIGLPTQRTQIPIAREIQRLYPEAEIDVRRAPTR